MILTIIILSLIGFLMASLYLNVIGRKGAAFLITFFMALNVALTFYVFYNASVCENLYFVKLNTWIYSDIFQIDWGFQVDNLTMTMLIVVNVVSAVVHLYSTNYIAQNLNKKKSSFVLYLLVFTLFMLLLITKDNSYINLDYTELFSILMVGSLVKNVYKKEDLKKNLKKHYFSTNKRDVKTNTFWSKSFVVLKELCILGTQVFSFLGLAGLCTFIVCKEYLKEELIYEPFVSESWIVNYLNLHTWEFITVMIFISFVISTYCYIMSHNVNSKEKWAWTTRIAVGLNYAFSYFASRGYDFISKFLNETEVLWSNPYIGEMRRKLSSEKIYVFIEQFINKFKQQQKLNLTESDQLRVWISDTYDSFEILFQQGSTKALQIMSNNSQEWLRVIRARQVVEEISTKESWYQFMTKGSTLVMMSIALGVGVCLWFYFRKDDPAIPDLVQESIKASMPKIYKNADKYINTAIENKLPAAVTAALDQQINVSGPGTIIGQLYVHADTAIRKQFPDTIGPSVNEIVQTAFQNHENVEIVAKQAVQVAIRDNHNVQTAVNQAVQAALYDNHNVQRAVKYAAQVAIRDNHNVQIAVNHAAQVALTDNVIVQGAVSDALYTRVPLIVNEHINVQMKGLHDGLVQRIAARGEHLMQGSLKEIFSQINKVRRAVGMPVFNSDEIIERLMM